jgi:hypothetical protein
MDDREANLARGGAGNAGQHSVHGGLVATVVAVLVDNQHVTNRPLTHDPSVTVGDN